MSRSCDITLDLPTLRALVTASDAEAQRETAFTLRLASTEALQMELWRQRRALIDAAGGEPFVAALRPFARVAQLLDPSSNGLMLSLRTYGAAVDFVQLRPADFFAARELVEAAHG
jgi:hypothetical protein